MRELAKIVKPGELIFDPFAGSGTTGVGALLEGRRFIGCEKIPHYAELARQRLAAVVDAPTLFDQPSIDQDPLGLEWPEVAPELAELED